MKDRNSRTQIEKTLARLGGDKEYYVKRHPENIPLVPNDWLKTQVNYEGRGRTEFHDPSGAIEGTAEINRGNRWHLLLRRFGRTYSPQGFDVNKLPHSIREVYEEHGRLEGYELPTALRALSHLHAFFTYID